MIKVISAAVLFRCVSSDQILRKDEAKVCVIIIWDWKPSWKKNCKWTDLLVIFYVGRQHSNQVSVGDSLPPNMAPANGVRGIPWRQCKHTIQAGKTSSWVGVTATVKPQVFSNRKSVKWTLIINILTILCHNFIHILSAHRSSVIRLVANGMAPNNQIGSRPSAFQIPVFDKRTNTLWTTQHW